MTQVKMPEPVAWLHVCRKKPELRGLLYEKSAPELAARGFVPEPLITTTQAKAYADARVREALEEAAQLCDAQHFGGDNDDDLGWTSCAANLAHDIRALIPSTPA